jgi:hypothetical protein
VPFHHFEALIVSLEQIFLPGKTLSNICRTDSPMRCPHAPPAAVWPLHKTASAESSGAHLDCVVLVEPKTETTQLNDFLSNFPCWASQERQRAFCFRARSVALIPQFEILVLVISIQ